MVSGMDKLAKRPAETLNNTLTSTPSKPITKETRMQTPSDDVSASLQKFMQSINEKLKKLDKLDTISAQLDTMDVDI